MRISNITDRFVALQARSGCSMRSSWDSETKTQTLRYGREGSLIAEIFDYTDQKNYRLRIHPNKERWGRTAHSNRLYAVLVSVQRPDKDTDWSNVRYSTHIRYALKVWDRKLSAEYELYKAPMEFTLKDGRLVMDYAHLESNAFPDEEKPTPVVELNSNSNLQSVNSKLTAILQGV